MSEINEPSLCCLCGNPMPPGEDMFKFHGYSGDCPPKYPPCLPDRKPHRDRVRDISQMMGEGQTSAIAIDDTPVHREWYLHELTKYPRLTVVDRWTSPWIKGPALDGVYIIKVRQGPRLN